MNGRPGLVLVVSTVYERGIWVLYRHDLNVSPDLSSSWHPISSALSISRLTWGWGSNRIRRVEWPFHVASTSVRSLKQASYACFRDCLTVTLPRDSVPVFNHIRESVPLLDYNGTPSGLILSFRQATSRYLLFIEFVGFARVSWGLSRDMSDESVSLSLARSNHKW